MHALFVSHSAELMGAERSLLALVGETVRARGYQVTVTLPGDGPLRAQLAATGAEVVVLPTRLWMGRRYGPAVGAVRLLQALASVPRYRRLLERTRPDVVVTNSAVVPAGAIAARMARLRHVWVVRESLLSNPSLRSVLPRAAIAQLIARLSDGVVAVSAYVAGQVTSAVPTARAKLRVIPPPVESGPDASGPSEPDSVSEPAGASDTGADRPAALERLVLLGRHSAEKGQQDAVEALAICARRGRAFTLTLAGVGDGEARRGLADLARRYGVEAQLETVAWTDDPAALYARADVTLMLSRNEAYGRVTFESLRSGTPVIGYRAGATTEILAGGGGLLVDSDAGALARALLDLAADREAFGQLTAEAVRRGRELATEPSPAGRFVAYLEELGAVS
ncbi:glycosyltransferase involved in cell wall biosynthesis [Micromonospora sp. Llam0]|uniref:glycosyltransferase n=1 Tax=Micromonospora sp. Llam0 TaxID=2485143 RepID=UPI000F46445B|nr:glycosyltransferase [Micromonospora sp. Llam0]ROO62056.1 glycosyltransferase involved in cell wall biosynthesis [Micromonospora sp. Llam0]